jgi:GMP reductase
MDTVGTFATAQVLVDFNMLTCIHKHYSLDAWRTQGPYRKKENHVIISSGIGTDDLAKVNDITDIYPDINFLCLDVANGYSQPFATAVEQLRVQYPTYIIIAGNVATPEMTEELILRGADIVKVGIGPGKACETRTVTGVGYPQLSAVMECADAAHGLNGHIIADGGCETPGDVAKAFCAGADFVMLGYMLAGHDETGAEFYGMSSKKAQKKYNGAVLEYRASEGTEMTIEPRGSLADTVQQILGGLRSAATYIGAIEIKHMPKCATFLRVNRVK